MNRGATGLRSEPGIEFSVLLMTDVSNLLVVIPTLGTSPHLPSVIDDVGQVSRLAGVTAVLVAPESSCGALRKEWPGIPVICETPGGGMYGAINLGAESLADWDWLTWINDDDRLLHGFEDLWRCAQAAPAAADVWYGEVDYIGLEGGKLAAMPVCRRPVDVPALLAAGLAPFTQQGALISRDLWRRIGGMDASLRIAGDFDFWIRAAASGARFRFVPGTVAAYRMRPGQLSGGVAQARREEEAVLRRCNLAVGRARRWMASVRFRAANLPRIIQRIRRTGRLRSRQIYAH